MGAPVTPQQTPTKERLSVAIGGRRGRPHSAFLGDIETLLPFSICWFGGSLFGIMVISYTLYTFPLLAEISDETEPARSVRTSCKDAIFHGERNTR